ncbi:hypothetical protein Hokovirus_1_298 [Hokovirus HKV1]|uniref:Uncharacterized protein n=1 Tax=Hokovirus HKV1 TaxID=1977638 RepID=A0A1V0SFB8_9VIRU|nr:hypothetical protein Hokovirus_1_298 [Hokovirus HKV1]
MDNLEVIKTNNQCVFRIQLQDIDNNDYDLLMTNDHINSYNMLKKFTNYIKILHYGPTCIYTNKKYANGSLYLYYNNDNIQALYFRPELDYYRYSDIVLKKGDIIYESIDEIKKFLPLIATIKNNVITFLQPYFNITEITQVDDTIIYLITNLK